MESDECVGCVYMHKDAVYERAEGAGSKSE